MSEDFYKRNDIGSTRGPPTTLSESNSVIDSIRDMKAPDPDNISSKLLKDVYCHMKELLFHMITTCLTPSLFWLHNASPPPITSLKNSNESCYEQIKEKVKNYVDFNQFGCRMGNNSVFAFNFRNKTNQKVHTVFIILEKAFDRVEVTGFHIIKSL